MPLHTPQSLSGFIASEPQQSMTQNSDIRFHVSVGQPHFVAKTAAVSTCSSRLFTISPERTMRSIAPTAPPPASTISTWTSCNSSPTMRQDGPRLGPGSLLVPTLLDPQNVAQLPSVGPASYFAFIDTATVRIEIYKI